MARRSGWHFEHISCIILKWSQQSTGLHRHPVNGTEFARWDNWRLWALLVCMIYTAELMYTCTEQEIKNQSLSSGSICPSSCGSYPRQSGRNCWAFRPLWERLFNRWADLQLTHRHCRTVLPVQLFTTQQGLGSENERLRQDIDTLRSHLQEAMIKRILGYLVICCNHWCRMLVTCVEETHSVSHAETWSRDHQADCFTASV